MQPVGAIVRDSLCRDSTYMQYMQYSSKTIKTQLRMCFKLKQAPSIHLRVILEPGKLTSFPKSIVDKVKVCRSKSVFCSIMITHKRPFVSYHYWTKYTKRMLIKRTDPRTLILAINSHTISLLSVAVERHFLVMYACALVPKPLPAGNETGTRHRCKLTSWDEVLGTG